MPSMPGIEQRELERFRYEQGQVIRSGDFNDQAANDDQLRWWHNRSLHNAYGVAFGILQGFDVELTDSSAREVTVRPGVAYDCFGRELLLLRDRKSRIPEEISEGTATLLLQYQPPAARADSCMRMPLLHGPWYLTTNQITQRRTTPKAICTALDFNGLHGLPLDGGVFRLVAR